jgi:serine/threonine protein kinase
MQFRELTDRYQLEKILKSNRFGTVLRATDSTSGRTVVVKLVTVPSPPRLVAGAPELERLAGLLAAPGSPNLPTVLDHGFTTDGSAFLVLEPLEGKGLDALGGAPPARVLARIAQALDGLEILGTHGIAHLNVSPDNLFVVQAPQTPQTPQTPEDERVVLLGLGTAVFRPRDAEATATGAGENARFHAPEMAAGGAGDTTADIYSLALTACTALGATVGFGEAPVVQLPLSVSFELENDEALRQALERSLRREPGERPSWAELRQALRLATGEAAPAARPAAAPVPAPVLATVAPFPTPSPAKPIALVEIPNAWTPAQAAPSLAVAATAPEEPGDALSAVDDEILNALLSVPAPPPRPAGPPAQPQRGAKVVPFLKKSPPAPAMTPSGRTAVIAGNAGSSGIAGLLRRPAVLGAIAAGVVLAALAGFWLLRRPSPEAVVVQAPSGPALPLPPTRPPVEKLEEAKLYLAQGDDLKARRVLRSIPWGEQGLLPPEGCRVLSSIQQNLALAALERLPSDLASGLKSGDLEVLQTAVEAGAGQEATLAPDLRASYDRARGIADAYAQARAAAAQNNPVQTLERFATLAGLLPRIGDPDDLRGKAAAAIEKQAEALVRDGKYAEAVTRLAPVERTWPDRPGIKERAARYHKYQQDEARQEELLASVPNLERHKKPWDGLQMMNGVEPTPHLAPRFAEARARLEDLLARLDKEPPQLVLRDGFLLDYDRGTVVNLSFRASDDYQVKEVKLLARPEGGKFRELPLARTRTGYYTVEIQPAFHQNGTVDFYAVATDLSGHETSLGSRDKPLQLKRKQGFRQLIR